jgi:hypothetical protein
MKRELPKEYTEVRNAIKNDSKCCGPIALAVVTGIKPSTAQSKLAKLGRKRHHGTYTYQLLEAVKQCGFTVKYLKRLSSECKTVRSLEKRGLGSRTLLVFTSSHVLAVKNGKVCDWTANRLHRITGIYIVEKA